MLRELAADWKSFSLHQRIQLGFMLALLAAEAILFLVLLAQIAWRTL